MTTSKAAWPSVKEYISALTIFAGEPVPQIIYSNLGDFVEQRYLFDTLWSIARPGRHRIAEIEQGRQPEFMELITDPSKASKTFARLIQSAEKKGLALAAKQVFVWQGL